jgi:hypothetical protein
MRALSIKQYYLYAITDLDKRYENRTFKPPEWLHGTRIALHASQRIAPESEMQVARIAGIDALDLPDRPPTGCIVATAVLDGYVTHSADKWFYGPYGWQLSRVIKLDMPLPCRGHLNFWTVPADIEMEINRQLVRDGVIKIDL